MPNNICSIANSLRTTIALFSLSFLGACGTAESVVQPDTRRPVAFILKDTANRRAKADSAIELTLPTSAGAIVRVDFSGCPADFRPIWFAVQDGNGPWTAAERSGDEYRFTIASSKGGYAFVLGVGYRDVRVAYATADELTKSPVQVCGPPLATLKSATGQLAGMGSRDVANIGLGASYRSYRAEGPVSGFALSNIPSGQQDLIAYRTGQSSGTGAAIIRRDLEIADNSRLETVNFASAEAFLPVTVPVTVTGMADRPGYYLGYLAGAGCAYYELSDVWDLGTQFNVSGIPSARQRANDFHQLSIYFNGVADSPGGNVSRSVTETFHTMSPRAIAAPILPTPTVSMLPGRSKRVSSTIAFSSAETSAMLRYFYRHFSRVLEVSATSGWLRASSATIAVPDFSAAPGWQDEYLAAANELVNWSVTTTSYNEAARGGNCVEGARWATVSISGTR